MRGCDCWPQVQTLSSPAAFKNGKTHCCRDEGLSRRSCGQNPNPKTKNHKNFLAIESECSQLLLATESWSTLATTNILTQDFLVTYLSCWWNHSPSESRLILSLLDYMRTVSKALNHLHDQSKAPWSWKHVKKSWIAELLNSLTHDDYKCSSLCSATVGRNH
jgi:hypothetical protein